MIGSVRGVTSILSCMTFWRKWAGIAFLRPLWWTGRATSRLSTSRRPLGARKVAMIAWRGFLRCLCWAWIWGGGGSRDKPIGCFEWDFRLLVQLEFTFWMNFSLKLFWWLRGVWGVWGSKWWLLEVVVSLLSALEWSQRWCEMIEKIGILSKIDFEWEGWWPSRPPMTPKGCLNAW